MDDVNSCKVGKRVQFSTEALIVSYLNGRVSVLHTDSESSILSETTCLFKIYFYLCIMKRIQHIEQPQEPILVLEGSSM